MDAIFGGLFTEQQSDLIGWNVYGYLMSYWKDLDDQLRLLEPSDLNLECTGVSHLNCVSGVEHTEWTTTISSQYLWMPWIYLKPLYLLALISHISAWIICFISASLEPVFLWSALLMDRESLVECINCPEELWAMVHFDQQLDAVCFCIAHTTLSNLELIPISCLKQYATGQVHLMSNFPYKQTFASPAGRNFQTEQLLWLAKSRSSPNLVKI